MRPSRLRGILLAAATVFLLGLHLLPTLYSSLVSFSVSSGGLDSPTLRWYAEILSEGRLASSVLRSLWASLVIALIATSICTLAMAMLRQQPLKIRRLLIALILLPLFVPETTHALTLSDFLAQHGLTKGWWALVLSVSVYVVPFTAIVILLSTSGIPPTLDLAAKDMGMSALSRLIRVTIPLIWVACAFSFLFSFILSFNEHARTAYFEGREMYSVYLRGNLAGGGSQAIYAVSTAMSVTGLFLLLLLYWKSRKSLDSMG